MIVGELVAALQKHDPRLVVRIDMMTHMDILDVVEVKNRVFVVANVEPTDESEWEEDMNKKGGTP